MDNNGRRYVEFRTTDPHRAVMVDRKNQQAIVVTRRLDALGYWADWSEEYSETALARAAAREAGLDLSHTERVYLGDTHDDAAKTR